MRQIYLLSYLSGKGNLNSYANEYVANLLVPLTDEKTQLLIVEETLARQAESARLRAHAETVWRQARERFEQQLLQGGTS